MGVLLIWRHKLMYVALTLCKHVCKVDCDVKSGVDPLPFWRGREQKMQDLLQGGKNGCTAFRTAAKINFSEKNILGLGTVQ